MATRTDTVYIHVDENGIVNRVTSNAKKMYQLYEGELTEQGINYNKLQGKLKEYGWIYWTTQNGRASIVKRTVF